MFKTFPEAIVKRKYNEYACAFLGAVNATVRRQHSSKMPTARLCLLYICFKGHKMSALVGGPQVNMFEQDCSIGHQMALAVGARTGGPFCVLEVPAQ